MTILIFSLSRNISVDQKTFNEPVDAFSNLRAKCKASNHSLLEQLRKKFKRMRCNDLRNFIHTFKALLLECVDAEGLREDTSTYDALVRQVDKKQIVMLLYQSSTIDEAFDYFKGVTQKKILSLKSIEVHTSQITKRTKN